MSTSKSKARLTAIQMHSVPDVDENLQAIRAILENLTNEYGHNPEHLVVLPEACLYFGGRDKDQLSISEDLGTGHMQESLAQLAKEFSIYLSAGTIPLNTNVDNKFSASNLLFGPQGELLDDYQKIHLFDVDVNDNKKSYRESLFTVPGEKVVISQLDNIKLGMTVCYDLRFPELYRALRGKGANVIANSAAFTKVTGRAHWQALLQARAIENQVYMVAAGQVGTHQNGKETYGHSMIVNPWGEIVAIKEEGTGYISVELEPELISKVRADIPVNEHNQFSVTLNK
ncbi:carbon-nitrogen hydrolase family protein [Thalassomonas sp. M1454]|uniref:carbon-nitrogen hydrolase family protein n=1 Tax=Thalassomonas sp. M1454 TaxID=2594477 RepID=UPI001180E645|nr:carbon-nitrogen hydrolase family protein [Thalassomonas sp. M1454]TRX52792.1 carbon-nitrogen hydrolase family protein [Thalassomonas sp. M1454]